MLSRFINYPPAECLEECNYIEYIADITSTQLSDDYAKEMMRISVFPKETKFISLNVYYKTLDLSRVAYHGKVCICYSS
jgi:hypothetical protein